MFIALLVVMVAPAGPAQTHVASQADAAPAAAPAAPAASEETTATPLFEQPIAWYTSDDLGALGGTPQWNQRSSLRFTCQASDFYSISCDTIIETASPAEAPPPELSFSESFLQWKESGYQEVAGTRYRYGADGLAAGNPKAGTDCSHFVRYVMCEVSGDDVPYCTTGTIPQAKCYQRVSPPETPQAGDLILFDGHVGVISDPVAQTFIGAQNDGVAETDYKKGSHYGNQRYTVYRYVG